jgi:lysylphosphatidylglycerol synthetase-like protein (DUF2156 family)
MDLAVFILDFGRCSAASRLDRPTGVTILAALQFVSGLILTIIAFVLWVLSISSSAVVFILASGLLLFCFVLVYAAWGLWSGKGWAWTLTVVLMILGLIVSVAEIASGSYSNVISLVVGALILWYLYRPPVRDFFEEERAIVPESMR